MKYVMKSLAGSFQFSQNLNKQTKPKSLIFPLLALAAGLVLAANPAQAQTNLLQNPGFETPPSGQIVPTDWTYFAPPTLPPSTKDYWVVDMGSVGSSPEMPPHSGTFFWKEWWANSGVNNVAGLYQTFSSSPGSIYQASGWLSTSTSDALGAECATWLQVEFLDVNTNVLALYKSPNFSSSMGTQTWFQFSVTNACDLTQPVSTGDPYFTTYAETGSVNQLVAPAGTASVRYRYCYLAVGTNEVGSAYLDDTALNLVSGPVPPVINNLFPQNNMIFVNPTNGISFNVTSPSGFTINNSGIQMIVNGTNVSGSLAISGSASSKNVAYSGLQSNSTYTASISVTDVSNLNVNTSIYFQTMWYGIQPVTYLWEAEDWDFNSGMYIDVPDLCNAPGDPDCYFGKVGVQTVDEYYTIGTTGGVYRADDLIGQAPSGDYLRPNLYNADRVDYCINPFNYGEWVNYTRDWPASTNWIICRAATGAGSGSMTLSQVTGTTTNVLGTFTINSGLGWTAFQNVYLQGTNNQNVSVVLNGPETLQLTAYPGAALLPNFFMLVAAEPDLPVLSNLYPDGTHPFEPTNTLSFTATTVGATFPAGGITVNLDGYNVTPALEITGSSSVANVVYPTLQLNAMHTAIINVTNSLGHGISVTNQFDTFNQTNYSFEAEDFDYNGGQFVSPWTPDCYAGFTSVSNIDFQHTPVNGEPTDGSEYQYRLNGIPQELTDDYQREIFVEDFAYDYMLYWYGATDWQNYTRVYPTGSYYAYARTSGDGPFSMDLAQVVSGAGTTNQVTKSLGQWSAVGAGITVNAWVPLTDNGLVAPVAVNVGGTNTLRVSTPTGDCYPNFFMLVPASGVKLSAALAGGNVQVSFPTQTGSNYRVFYRTSLTTGNWTLLNSVLGNGSVMSVSDSGTATNNVRFYEVTSP
jgi:hypothetical protein